MYCTQVCCMELFHQQLRLKPIFYWSFRPSTLLLCQQTPVYHNQHLCLHDFNFDAIQQICHLVRLSWWHSFPNFDAQLQRKSAKYWASCRLQAKWINFNQSTEIRQTTRSLVDSLKTRTWPFHSASYVILVYRTCRDLYPITQVHLHFRFQDLIYPKVHMYLEFTIVNYYICQIEC